MHFIIFSLTVVWNCRNITPCLKYTAAFSKMSTYLYRISNQMQGNKLKRSNSLSSCKKNEDEARCVIEELKEKMSRLKFRLLDCQNQNHMLRKELLLAKKVVNTEVSLTANGSFGDLLNQSTSTDYRGRREKILLLKDKLSELQNRIKEIEDGNMDKLSEFSVKTQKIERVEDEKNFQNKQMMDKELQYLLENSCQMKRKLEVWKKRTAELSKEAELLRLELDRLLEKNKEDRDVHESYHAVEKELRARQSEKLDLRTKLDGEKTRNEQLVEELASVKEDISLILSKINDDKLLIEALKNQQGYLHDLLDRQKMISENDNRRFKDDLKEIQLRHTTNCDMLHQIKNIVGEKSFLCELLQQTLNQKPLIDEEKDNELEKSAESVTIESEQCQQDEPPQQPEPTSDSNPDSSEEPVEVDSEVTKLTEERDQYVDLFRSLHEEIGRQTDILSKNSERLNEWMAQLFQSRSLLAQKTAEIYGLQEMAKRLERPLSSTKKLGTSPQNCSRFEAEIKETNDVLNEEYQFLLCLWELLMTNKENSIFVFMISIDSAKQLFAEAVNDLILSEDKSSADGRQGDNEEIVGDETNNETVPSDD